MKKLIAAADLGAALIAGSVVGAGTALADELSDLQAINELCPNVYAYNT